MGAPVAAGAPGHGVGMSEQGGLVPAEGVDEGSAASTAEGPDGPVGGVDGPVGASDDVLGEAPRGAPADEAQAAGPVDTEPSDVREGGERLSPGQQFQEGEG